MEEQVHERTTVYSTGNNNCCRANPCAMLVWRVHLYKEVQISIAQEYVSAEARYEKPTCLSYEGDL